MDAKLAHELSGPTAAPDSRGHRGRRGDEGGAGSRPDASGDSPPKLRPRGDFRYELLSDEVWWSDGVAKVFGRAPGFAPANCEDYLSLVHPDDRGAAAARVGRAIEEQGGFDALERVLYPDGRVATVRCVVHVELSPEGVPLALVGTSELIRMELPVDADAAPTLPAARPAIAPVSRPAANSASSSSSWASPRRTRAEIGHDLNNLVQVLACAVDLSEAGDTAALSPLNLRRTIAAAAELGDELLNPSTSLTPELELTDLCAWIRNFRPQLESFAGPDTHFTLRVPRVALYTGVNRNRLEQALMNLVTNAREASHTGGRIELRVEPMGHGRLLIEIKDEGCGIASDSLHRVWDRGETTKGPGRGQGLGIARRDIESMGGVIELESEQGRGTRVRVYLPRERVWVLNPRN